MRHPAAVLLACLAAAGAPPAADPADAGHVARIAPGWYHGDFHMHGYHSNPAAPEWEDFVAQARAAKLDFLMVTEYVTGRHWKTLGAVQRAHPDLLIWPGREIITYFGHVNTHGETPGLHEYRHGFEDVDIGTIQREAKARGALFQVNHPTLFPPPLFSNFCRGCYFELGERIDWAQVDTIEILTGPAIATGADLGAPLPG
ncbi:MAG: CehA/McbA family metallohydrolase [Gammaproteobacteria bacterium]|nr:CehA/McbA family metallohydrolase [Gammaproteobacteria bacterium]